jgi:hypothetical protein
MHRMLVQRGQYVSPCAASQARRAVPMREACGELSDTRSNTCVQKVVCLALDRTTKG